MSPAMRLFIFFALQHVFAAPAPIPAAVGPSVVRKPMPSSTCTTCDRNPLHTVQYEPNPSIGPGGSPSVDSAHFRVYTSDTTTASTTLKMLEAAHTCFVETLGWRTPGLSYKSDTGTYYKMNVYPAKESDMPGAAAQTWTDNNRGFAYLKVVTKYLANPSIVVHEFGHAMTYSEKNWIDQTRTGAWWETIANFIADTYIATPVCTSAKQSAGVSTALGDSLIELKKVIGDSYQVIVDGSSGTGNYYQAWPFLVYITNNPDAYPGLGKEVLQNMIRKYSLNSNETPLHSLARLLGNTSGGGGVTVQQVVARYWARMAYVDIGHAKARTLFEAQRKSLNYANVDAGGGGKWMVKSARAPRYMGASIVPLKASGGNVSVEVTAASGGGSTGLRTTLAVRGADGSGRYVDAVGGKASVVLGSGEEVSLVVVNAPAALVQYDAFSLSAEVNRGVGWSVQISGAQPS